MKRLAAFLWLLLAVPLAAEVLPRSDGETTEIRVWDGPSACGPLAVLSHGFGGNPNTLARIARMLQGEGFEVIALGHAQSGRAALQRVLRATDRRRALIEAAGNKDAHLARFLDLDAALVFAAARCTHPFKVLIGHSMGAQTTMMEAGAMSVIGRMGEDRFNAYVALSPQGIGLRYQQGAWRRVGKPVLMVTGTEDKGVDGSYLTRLSAFEGLPVGHKRLAVVAGGSHMNMGGRGAGAAPRLVLSIISDFLREIRTDNLSLPASTQAVTYRQK